MIWKFRPTSHLLGDMKSSSPSESPLMEKRDLNDSQEDPVPKPITEEMSAPTEAPADRKVMFDIGCADDGENKDCSESADADGTDGTYKERRVAFNIGDSDDNDYSNECKFKKRLIKKNLF